MAQVTGNGIVQQMDKGPLAHGLHSLEAALRGMIQYISLTHHTSNHADIPLSP